MITPAAWDAILWLQNGPAGTEVVEVRNILYESEPDPPATSEIAVLENFLPKPAKK